MKAKTLKEMFGGNPAPGLFVCPTCGGRRSKRCTQCGGRGFVVAPVTYTDDRPLVHDGKVSPFRDMRREGEA